MRTFAWACVALFYVAAADAPPHAQEHEAGDDHAHRHEVAFLVGATYEADKEKNFATLGGEYEFKVHPRLGVGVGLEYLFDVDAAVLVFPFTFHVGRGFMLVAAPGVEMEPRHEPDPHAGQAASGHGDGGDERDYLTRIGAQYKVEVGGRYSVVPFVAVDFVNRSDQTTKALVYGGKFAVGF